MGVSNRQPAVHRRIVVIGTSGSGKTTLARNIAHRLGIKHIELDELHFGPNWTEVSEEVMQQRLVGALAGDCWVVDGNYGLLRDYIWSRAETIVWLNFSLPLIMARLTRRTFRHVFKHEELWHGNRESLRMALMSRDSILLWALTTYRRRRKEYSFLFGSPQYAHINFVELHTPRQVREWLESLTQHHRLPTRG